MANRALAAALDMAARARPASALARLVRSNWPLEVAWPLEPAWLGWGGRRGRGLQYLLLAETALACGNLAVLIRPLGGCANFAALLRRSNQESEFLDNTQYLILEMNSRISHQFIAY